MALRPTAAHGMRRPPSRPGTRARAEASSGTVAPRGRASARALTLVVITTAACNASDPAAPPTDRPTKDIQAPLPSPPSPATTPSPDPATTLDPPGSTTPDPPATTPDHALSESEAPSLDRSGQRPGPSLARRIAPLLTLPQVEPIAEGFSPTGNAACDRYLRNYLRCIERTMAAESVEAIRQSLLSSSQGWIDLREQPGGADALRATCEAVEKAGRDVVVALGCEWE